MQLWLIDVIFLIYLLLVCDISSVSRVDADRSTWRDRYTGQKVRILVVSILDVHRYYSRRVEFLHSVRFLFNIMKGKMSPLCLLFPLVLVWTLIYDWLPDVYFNNLFCVCVCGCTQCIHSEMEVWHKNGSVLTGTFFKTQYTIHNTGLLQARSGPFNEERGYKASNKHHKEQICTTSRQRVHSLFKNCVLVYICPCWLFQIVLFSDFITFYSSILLFLHCNFILPILIYCRFCFYSFNSINIWCCLRNRNKRSLVLLYGEATQPSRCEHNQPERKWINSGFTVILPRLSLCWFAVAAEQDQRQFFHHAT